MSCIDLTLDSDSEGESSWPVTVKPEPRSLHSSRADVIDLTDSPVPAVPMKATNNTSGKCLRPITDFYPPSPNKKARVEQLKQDYDDVIVIDTPTMDDAESLAGHGFSALNSRSHAVESANSRSYAMRVETPAERSPERDEYSLSGARTPSSPTSRAIPSGASSGDSYVTAVSGAGARKSISPAQKIVSPGFAPIYDGTLEQRAVEPTAQASSSSAMSVDVSLATSPGASASALSALVTPVYHTSSAHAKPAEVVKQEPEPLSSGMQIEDCLKDLLSCVSLFKSYTDPVLVTHADRATDSSLPEQPSSSSSAAQTRVKLLEKLLFPPSLSESKPAELCNADFLLCMMQDAYRENPTSPGMRKLMNQALRQHNIRVYLMLAETKCAALRRSVGQQRRGEAACVAFEVLGLGDPPLLLDELRRLLQGDGEDGAQHSGDNSKPSSGEKAARAVSSKSSERKAVQQRINEAFTASGNSCGGEAAGDGAAGLTVTAGGTTVRTLEDAKRAIAEKASARSALGRRVLATCRDYTRLVSEQRALSTHAALSEKVLNYLIDFVCDLDELAGDLRRSDVTPAGLDNKPRSAARSAETVAERDARLAAAAVTELCGEIYELFLQPSQAPGEGDDQEQSGDGVASTLVTELVSEVVRLEEDFPALEDWIAQRGEAQDDDEGEVDAADRSKYATTIVQATVSSLHAVLKQWDTLRIGDAALRFVTHQLYSISARAADRLQLIADIHSVSGDEADSAPLPSLLRDCDESSALRAQCTKLRKAVADIVVRTKLTLCTRTHTPTNCVCGASETVMRCVEELAGKYPAGTGRKSREEKLAAVLQQLSLLSAP